MADENNGAATLWHQLSKADQQKALKAMKRVEQEKPIQPGKARNGQFQLKGYCRCELAASDKEAFKQWETTREIAATMEAVIKECDSGYLLKVGENGSGYQASLSALSTSQEWDGYVLTAHAGSALRAVTLLIYKHQILMSREWSAWMSDDSEDALR